MQPPARDRTLRVEGIPPSILGKITEYTDACFERAFIGTLDAEDHLTVEELYHISRYNLERTIKTELEKARANTQS